MTLEFMLEHAYDHLICCPGQDGLIDDVVVCYAAEQLHLPEPEIAAYVRAVATEDQIFFPEPERYRFLTWYYINFIAPCPPELLPQPSESPHPSEPFRMSDDLPF